MNFLLGSTLWTLVLTEGRGEIFALLGDGPLLPGPEPTDCVRPPARRPEPGAVGERVALGDEGELELGEAPAAACRFWIFGTVVGKEGRGPRLPEPGAEPVEPLRCKEFGEILRGDSEAFDVLGDVRIVAAPPKCGSTDFCGTVGEGGDRTKDVVAPRTGISGLGFVGISGRESLLRFESDDEVEAVAGRDGTVGFSGTTGFSFLSLEPSRVEVDSLSECSLVDEPVSFAFADSE